MTNSTYWKRITIVLIILGGSLAADFALLDMLGNIPAPRPNDLPVDAFNQSKIAKQVNDIDQLCRDCRSTQNFDFETKLKQIIDTCNTPEELSMLAVWANGRDWEEKTVCKVHSSTFAECVKRLGKQKGPHPRYALWSIRQALDRNGHYDGKYATELLDAADDQKSWE